MQKLKTAALLLSLGCLSSSVVLAADFGGSLFARLRGSIESLPGALPGKEGWRDGEFAYRWKGMGEKAGFLQSKAEGHRVSEEYGTSIEAAIAALRYIAEQSALALHTKLVICRGVDNDLGVKVQYAKNKPDDPFGSVAININTKDAMGQQVQNRYVWYVPEAWNSEPGRFARFHTMSSPIPARLAPGFYYLWVERTGGGQMGTRRELLAIDRDGSLDLLVAD